MADLDPAGPILAILFEAPSSDTIIDAVDRAGLSVDWTLDDRQSTSHKTRKREYRIRVGKALADLAATDRTKFLSQIAARLTE
jgi:hypothetical protein